jgi:hypothetical protein
MATQQRPTSDLDKCTENNGGQDRLTILKWTRESKVLLEHAVIDRDGELLDLVHEFMSGVLQISDLLQAFKKSPGGRIDGTRGVAKHLNLSRPAVYLRLGMVNLTAEDFREPGVTVVRLVEISKKISSLQRQVERQYSKQPQKLVAPSHTDQLD